MYLAGHDKGVVESIRDVTDRWGGDFFIEDGVSWKSCLRKWQESGGTVVHLTMYGLPLTSVETAIRESGKLLIIVGAEKVPGESVRPRRLQCLGDRPAPFRNSGSRRLPRPHFLWCRTGQAGPWRQDQGDPLQCRKDDRGALKPSVLVAGFSTRHVARSAFYAGYDVYAVDHFCDQDLAFYTKDRIGFEEFDELPDAIREMQGRHRIGHLVVTSGAEMLDTGLPVLGTSREVTAPFLDKMETQIFLENLDVPVPLLAGEDEYPVMLKPRIGSGGWRNFVARSAEEKKQWKETWPDVPSIAQRVVPGIPASVCCVTDGTHARALAVNEQILRGGEESAVWFLRVGNPVQPPSHRCNGQYR